LFPNSWSIFTLFIITLWFSFSVVKQEPEVGHTLSLGTSLSREVAALSTDLVQQSCTKTNRHNGAWLNGETGKNQDKTYDMILDSARAFNEAAVGRPRIKWTKGRVWAEELVVHETGMAQEITLILRERTKLDFDVQKVCSSPFNPLKHSGNSAYHLL
jgi:hypothetical protein